jgi:ABC-type oligopeptide transport system substrate-binding subunit
MSGGSWYADYPSPSDFFDLFFRCSAWKLAEPAATRNSSFFCNPGLDHSMDLADSEQGTQPARAAATWAAVDGGITYRAPWVPLISLTHLDFVSSRVRNCEYNPAFPGVLFDQLQIRHQ